jgi:hypothetical protein
MIWHAWLRPAPKNATPSAKTGMATNNPTTGNKTKLIMAKATLSNSKAMPILKFENLSSKQVLLSIIHLLMVSGLLNRDILLFKRK